MILPRTFKRILTLGRRSADAPRPQRAPTPTELGTNPNTHYPSDPLRTGTVRGPSRSSPRASSQVLAALVVVGLVMLLAAIAHAQMSKYARTKNFTHTEHYDRPIAPGNPTNALKMRIRGAEGQFLDNDQVRITTARIEHYPMNGKGTNLVANTPVCLFDPGMHTLTSTDRVDIIARDGAIVVNGSGGFRLETTNATLHVSNRVRTTIQGSLFQSGRLTHP